MGVGLTLAALLAVVAVVVRASPEERAEHLAEVASALLADGQTTEALRLAGEAVALSGAPPQARFVLARALDAAGDREAARSELQRLVEEYPDHAAAHAALARVALRRGDWSAADAAASRALDAAPGLVDALHVRASARLRSGDLVGALEDLEQETRIEADGFQAAFVAADLADLLARLTFDPEFADRADAAAEAAGSRIPRAADPRLASMAWTLLRGNGAAALDASGGIDDPSPELLRYRIEAQLMAGQASAATAEFDRHAERLTEIERRSIEVRLLLAARRIPEAAALVGSLPGLAGPPPEGERARAALEGLAGELAHPTRLLGRGLARPATGLSDVEPLVRMRARSEEGVPRDPRAALGLFGPHALDRLQDGVEDEITRRFAAALSALQSSAPDDAFTLVWTAAAHLAGGQASSALPLAEQAVLAAPSLPEAWHVRGLAQLALGDPTGAAADAQRAFALPAARVPFAVAWSQAERLSGRAAAAAEAARAGLDRWPGSPSLLAARVAALTDLGEAAPQAALMRDLLALRLMAGDQAAAEGEAQRLIRIAPADPSVQALWRETWRRAARASRVDAATDPAAWLEAAIASERAGEPAEALAALESAATAEASPESLRLRAQLLRAQLLVRCGRPDEAVQDLLRAAERPGHRAQCLFALGELERGREDPAAAESAYRDAAGVEDADDALRLRAVRRLLETSADSEAAAAFAGSVIRGTAADTPGRRLTLAWLELANGEPARALQSARALADAAPADAGPKRLAVHVHLHTADLQRADAAVTECLLQAPEDVEFRGLLQRVRLARARAYQAAGDEDGCRRALAGAFVGLPSDAAVGVLLGQALDPTMDEAALLAAHARLVRLHPGSIAPWITLGHAELARGRAAAARRAFGQAAALAPDSRLAVVGLLRCAVSAENLAEVDDACDRLLAQGVWPEAAHHLQGQVRERAGDAQGALASYLAAAATPTTPQPTAAAVRLLRGSGRGEEARALVDDFERLTRNRPAAVLEVARLHALAGDAQRARVAFEAVLQGDPTNADAAYELGQVMLEAGKADAAAVAFVLAIEAAPDRVEPYVQWAAAMRTHGASAEIVPRLSAWAQERPESAGPRCALGIEAQVNGDVAAAGRHYRSALAILPEEPVAANNLAWALGVDGADPTAGLDVISRVARARPDHSDVQDTHGWLLHLAGRSADAVLPLERAVRAAPDSATTRLHLADVLYELRRRGEARAAYLRVVELDPRLGASDHVLRRLEALAGAR